MTTWMGRDTNVVEDAICVNDDDGDEIQVVSVRKKSWERREARTDDGCLKEDKVVFIDEK